MSEMSAPALPISGNNIGSKMMKAMGWVSLDGGLLAF